MPSPAGKKAWGEGTIEGSKGSRRGPSIGPELTNYSPPPGILASGFRRQEVPGATDLPCGLGQVTPHLWLKDGAEWGDPGMWTLTVLGSYRVASTRPGCTVLWVTRKGLWNSGILGPGPYNMKPSPVERTRSQELCFLPLS